MTQSSISSVLCRSADLFKHLSILCIHLVMCRYLFNGFLGSDVNIVLPSCTFLSGDTSLGFVL